MLVLYVSHRLQEILSIADRATVLRDGEKVATRPVTGLSMDELVFLMIGAASTSRAPRMASGSGTQLFDIRYRVGADESRLLLRGGEIVGLAGLVGAGRTTFARALAGAGRARAGVTLFRAGVEERIASPREAMRAGVAYLTEDRKRDGLFANLDIVANTSAAALTRVSRVGFRRPGRERKLAGGILERLRLHARTLDMPAGQLSGGNQQKVVFGRALLRAPQLLICDEPTRGVDVRTKGEFHSILAELAGQGVAVLVISSEIDELLAISHRIVVMRDRMLVAEMPVEEADEVSILVAASGGRQQQRAAVK
jgi:ABC-type sugar transport system ATPase subunit